MEKLLRLLIPVDFSENSMHALRYALKFSEYQKASLRLFHVVGVHAPPRAHITTEKLPGILRKYAKADCLKMIKAVRKDCSTAVSLDYAIQEDSLVAKTINKYASDHNFDLIIMGTKGARGLAEIFMGSVTAGTILNAGVPVMAIPSEYQIEEPDNILFVTNHFEKDKDLLDRIVGMAKLFSAVTHVALFVEIDKAKAGNNEYTGKLNAYMDFLSNLYPHISFSGKVLYGHDFEETIEVFNEQHQVDIIALITYPKNFLENLLLKSVTKKMAFHSKLPILAIPAG